jgi:uncharacterized RDD family membrane protein YckC
MFRKRFNSKSIFLISIAVAIAGLAADFVPGGPDDKVSTNIRYILNSIDLCPVSYMNGVLSYQWVNYALYAMLLTGAVLYKTSKQKETRLISFVFSAIFISNVVALVLSIFYTIRYFGSNAFTVTDVALSVLYKLVTLGWLYLAYITLKTLENATELEVQTTEHGVEIEPVICLANLWQRMFHLIVDGGILGLIIYAKIEVLMLTPAFKQALMVMQLAIGEKLSLIVVIVGLRTMYYLSLEGILGNTPGKYLAHTRLITYDGDAPPFNKVLVRSLFRSAPFDSVSFLSGNGWHDRWSGTTVAREKTKGVNGGWYFLAPLALVILGAVMLTIKTSYNQHLEQKAQNEVKSKQFKVFDEQLKHLTTNHFLELNNVDYYEAEKLIYLKVEKIEAHKILFSVIYGENHGNSPQVMIEKLYKQDKGNLKQIWFGKNDLQAAFKAKGMHSTDVSGLKIGSERYSVVSVQEFFAINIQLDNEFSRGGSDFEMRFKNMGWVARVIDIKPLTDNLKINSTNISSHNTYPNSFLVIDGMVNDNKEFSLQFTVNDSTGRQQIYQAKGNQNLYSHTLTRIK